MEHRQGPKIDRMSRQAPRQDLSESVQVSAAVTVNHAFRISRSAGGVAERDGVPLVRRRTPCIFWIPACKQRLVLNIPDAGTDTSVFRVVYVHDDHSSTQLLDRRGNCAGELAVNKNHLRFSMVEHERN